MFNVFQKTCRTCLKVDPDAVSVVQYTLYSTPRLTYAEILKDIARLEFKEDQSSNMPQQLCFTCCQQLRKAYVFVKQARESEDKLAKMLESQSEPVTVWPQDAAESQGVKQEDNDDMEFRESALPGCNMNLNLTEYPAFLKISVDPCLSKPLEIEGAALEQEHVLNLYEFENCNALDDKIEEMDNNSTLDFKNSLSNQNPMEKAASEEDNTLVSCVKSVDGNWTETKCSLNVGNSADELEITDTLDDVLVDDAKKRQKRIGLQYKCEHCTRQYSNEFNLRYHLIYKHQINYKSIVSSNPTQRPTKKLTLQCRSCDYTANTHAALHYHNRSKHGTEEDKIKCKFCAYTNVKKFSLFVHLKKFHLSKIKALKKIRRKNKKSGDNSYLDDYTEIDLENDCGDDSSDCSSGDENVIRDILTIKKRAPKTLTAQSDELQNNDTDQTKDTAPPLQNTSCTLCSSVVSRENLPIHMQTYHSDKAFDENAVFKPADKLQIFACDQCPRTYADRKKFKTHIKNKHDMDFKDFLKKQQKLSSEPKVYKCKFCEHTGNSAAAAHFHMLSKHGREEDKIKCNFCTYTNFKKFSLLTHMKGSHLSIVKMLKAQRNSGSQSLEDLINSIPTMPEPKDQVDKKPHECIADTCSSGDEDFIRDILNMKKRGGRTNIAKKFAIRCDECGNVYKDSHALNTHKRNVHGEHNYKPCPQCHRKYKRSYDLKLHILHAHTPSYVDPKQPPKIREKRFMCTECSYICATSTLLTIHTNRRHTGEKPYKCNVCSKSFVVPFDLKTHSYLHTGERPFKCSVCSKGFRDKSHMLKHKRIHSEVKPYNCSDCGKGFTKNYNLTIHKRTHMKGQKLNCLVCGKFFKDRAQLSIHQINEFHHDEAV